MSSRFVLDEAADWLDGLGVATDVGSDGRSHRLVAHHDEALARDVRRVVFLVDPTASAIQRGRTS